MNEEIYKVETPTSSNIARYQYNANERKLTIEFNRASGNCQIYEYENIPMDIFTGLSKAESVGKYFSQYIKGIFNFNKLKK
jgi:hypothetical protein